VSFRRRFERSIPTFRHCGLEYEIDLAKYGLAFVGRPGSGKTSLILDHVFSVLAHMHRAVFFDYKGEFACLLARRIPPERLTIVAPGGRGARWVFAKDIKSIEAGRPRSARALLH
jgi:hypothetical protein